MHEPSPKQVNTTERLKGQTILTSLQWSGRAATALFGGRHAS